MKEDIYKKLLNSLNKPHLFMEASVNSVIKSYVKEIQKELSDFTVSYEGSEIQIQSKKFSDFKVKAKISHIMNEYSLEAGRYYHGTKEILLNPTLLEEPQRLAATLAHETTHALQDYYVRNKEKLEAQAGSPVFSEYINMLSIRMDDKPIDVDCLNFKGTGSLHFKVPEKSKHENDYVHDLSKAFYSMHISESEAYKVGEKEMNNFCNHYNKTHNDRMISINDYNIVEKSFKKFNERYNLESYNNAKTEALYNHCYMKIHLQQQPENELEANIMYDMACLTLYNYKVQQNPQMEEYEHEYANGLIDETIKKSNLRRFGFDFIYPTGHIHHLTFDASAYMKFMGNEEAFLSEDVFFKKDNMKIFLMIAPEIGTQITEYIPDMDLLKQICINDRDELINSGSELIENGIKIIFGEEFWNQLNEEHDTNIVITSNTEETDLDEFQNDAEFDYTNSVFDEEDIEI